MGDVRDANPNCRVRRARSPTLPHRRDREDGALYQATFDAALESKPDWLLLSSFNEWVEGTAIEPGSKYGDLYMKLTCELTQAYKSR
ncbi:MAG: hypothetical protein HC853_03935 [Anaerolineae bacterium]|nr:hypothetical protein [Anaerolineae bacterium]